MSDATSGVVRKMTSTNHGARVARLIWMGCNLEKGQGRGRGRGRGVRGRVGENEDGEHACAERDDEDGGGNEGEGAGGFRREGGCVALGVVDVPFELVCEVAGAGTVAKPSNV